MIRWTGLAPWEFKFPLPGSLTSTFLVGFRPLRRNVQRFRGGLVFKAHRLCVSLNSRLESNNEEEVQALRAGRDNDVGAHRSQAP